jgi:hypothetical protein
MVSCQDIELRLIELLREDLPEDLLAHLNSCPRCKEKREQWVQLWSFMGGWEEIKPSVEVTESILSQIRGDLRSEAEASASPGWLTSGFGVVLISALVASLLSIGGSIVFHYGNAVELLKFALQQLEISAHLSAGTIFFLVGCLYGLLPLAIVGLIFGRLADGHRLRLSFWVVAIFLLVTLPYTVVECRTFALSFTLSIIAGLTVGAVSGGLAGFYLPSRRAMLVEQS